MLAVVGTVPMEDFPFRAGEVRLDAQNLVVGNFTIPVNRGTAALLAAAATTAQALGRQAPFAYLVGDTGTGKGSRLLYQQMTEALPRARLDVITFHYLQPIVHWHRRLQTVLGELVPRPLLIADAGFMYAAKMSGEAPLYDLFTPDAGELAFLADEEAPHPFYTRGFILHEHNHVPDLIARAYKNRNAARHLLVKGKKDYLADESGILGIVDAPVEEALEAMGGTGDTLTGLVSVLIDAGMPIREAALDAMRINRLAGQYTRPTPATQVWEMVKHIPEALREVLGDRVKSAYDRDVSAPL